MGILSENLVYKTKLTKEEAIKMIGYNVEKEKLFSFRSCKKCYVGNVEGNEFKIERVISYKNSFLPVIKGEIFMDFEGAKIKVDMKIHSSILVFMFIWCSIICFAGVACTYQLFTEEFNLIFLMPFGMLLFVFLLFYGGFKFESKKSIEDLKLIFSADEVLDLDKIKSK